MTGSGPDRLHAGRSRSSGLYETRVVFPRPRHNGYHGKRKRNMANLDWSQCPAVESIPGKVSGAWVFKNTRMPVATVFENLGARLTVEEVMEEFSVTREQVNAVLHFAAKSLEAPLPPPVRATPADAHPL